MSMPPLVEALLLACLFAGLLAAIAAQALGRHAASLDPGLDATADRLERVVELGLELGFAASLAWLCAHGWGLAACVGAPPSYRGAAETDSSTSTKLPFWSCSPGPSWGRSPSSSASSRMPVIPVSGVVATTV